MSTLRREGWHLVRVPLALILIGGGLLSFLPFLGIWMLPLGFLLLAIDLPILRAPLSALLIRARRRFNRLAIRWRARPRKP